MAAGVLRQVGAWQTGAGALGNTMGGTLPDGPLACSLSGLASFLCASSSAAGHRGGRGPLGRRAERADTGGVPEDPGTRRSEVGSMEDGCNGRSTGRSGCEEVLAGACSLRVLRTSRSCVL